MYKNNFFKCCYACYYEFLIFIINYKNLKLKIILIVYEIIGLCTIPQWIACYCINKQIDSRYQKGFAVNREEETRRIWMRWCHPTKQVRVCQYRSILSIVWWGEIILISRIIFEDANKVMVGRTMNDSQTESCQCDINTMVEEISLDPNN